jgi:hypothetical protein
MKTKEEIEQLATEHANLKPNFDRVEEEYYNSGAINAYESFIKGYTQCQEDNKDKKFTLDDMKKACAIGIDIAIKEGPNDFQPFEDLINSLNKQD